QDPAPQKRAAIASRLKARCSDAGARIGREAIQIHGAIGFTDEYDAGLYLKRALVLAAWLGNATQHRRRYAALALQAES
ncbi:MAG: acyl-CoA dehydrogenase family protein, partial [Burkholderiales bacterium]